MTIIKTINASPGQRLLWLVERYRGAESPLNVTACYRIRGPLDRAALRVALGGLVARHEALRTSYEFAGRRQLQHVHAPEPVTLIEHNVGDDPAALEAAMVEQARARHDISVQPVRFCLLEVSPEDCVLIISIHHLSTDGWSGGVISQELSRLYRPSAHGSAAAGLPGVARQFGDFCEWQQQRYDSGVLARTQKFWREQLAGANPPRLPGTSGSRSGPGHLPGLELFTLDEATLAGLTVLGRQRRTTIFVMALALFASVLNAQSGDTDLAVASMFANRVQPEFAGTVGFLANLVVLRLRLGSCATFPDVLDATRDVILDTIAYQEVPYHLIPQANGERGAGLENILFQVAAGPEYALRLAGTEVTQVSVPGGLASRFDLEFVLVPSANRIDGQVWYDRRRFDPSWVRQLVRDYQAQAATARQLADVTVTAG
jgi:hypothetical protein